MARLPDLWEREKELVAEIERLRAGATDEDNDPIFE